MSVRRPLIYAQQRLVRVFVCIAKAGRGGATLVELEKALKYAHRSAALGDALKVLLRWRVVTKQRMWTQPRAPYRYFAHRDAQEHAGRLGFSGWDRKWGKGRDNS